MAALGRVRLSPWLAAMAAVHILLGGGSEIALGLGCVFLHEMGHAAAAVALGAGVGVDSGSSARLVAWVRSPV